MIYEDNEILIEKQNKIILDLADHYRTVMSSKKCSFNKNASDKDIIFEYFNMIAKFETPCKKNVKYSIELEEKIAQEKLPAKVIDMIKYFKNKFEMGDDVNNHLSRLIYSASKRDILFDTWKVKHLHLNKTEATSKNQMKKNRSEFLLFFISCQDEYVFLDVKNHPEANEFTAYEMLKIIYNNNLMMEIGFLPIGDDYVPYSLKPEITEDKIIYQLYEAGINLSFDFMGMGYISIAGIASSGDRIETSLKYNQLIRTIQQVLVVGKDAEYIGLEDITDNACIIIMKDDVQVKKVAVQI